VCDDDDNDDDDGNSFPLVACGFFVSWVMLKILSSLSTGVGEQQELVVAVWENLVTNGSRHDEEERLFLDGVEEAVEAVCYIWRQAASGGAAAGKWRERYNEGGGG